MFNNLNAFLDLLRMNQKRLTAPMRARTDPFANNNPMNQFRPTSFTTPGPDPRGAGPARPPQPQLGTGQQVRPQRGRMLRPADGRRSSRSAKRIVF